MENIDLKIAEILGKGSAILHSDGLLVFAKLQSIDKSQITISFEKITHCTTAFLNACIGKFVIENKTNKSLEFVDASEDIRNKIKLVLDNVQNEKKRSSLNDSARRFFYA